ncbi:MAG: GNAT family N-acetyltransferase [Burkholderiales bacterium]
MNLLLINDEITLRELYEKDAESLFQLTDANRNYLRAWLPWLDQNTKLENTRWFIQNTSEQAQKNDAPTFGIWLRGELVGIIGYHFMDKTNRSTSIGYWLAEKFQGHGIMTKACAKLVDDALVTRKLNRVEIHCAVENKKSRAIPERLGFTMEGVLRQKEFVYDHHNDLAVYGLLSTDIDKNLNEL